MTVTRINVEWITLVPIGDNGSHDFDGAEWAVKEFPGNAIEKARKFAQRKANANSYGQAWLKVECAPYEKAPYHLWERDYSADETFTRHGR